MFVSMSRRRPILSYLCDLFFIFIFIFKDILLLLLIFLEYGKLFLDDNMDEEYE